MKGDADASVTAGLESWQAYLEERKRRQGRKKFGYFLKYLTTEVSPLAALCRTASGC